MRWSFPPNLSYFYYALCIEISISTYLKILFPFVGTNELYPTCLQLLQLCPQAKSLRRELRGKYCASEITLK